MESDIDEVESDFRSKKPSNRKHKPVKEKPKTAPKAKKVKKEDKSLKLTKKKVEKKSDTDENTRHNTTDTSYSDSKENQTGCTEKETETCHCPSCGKLFDVIQLPDHAKACLHDNFEACRLSRLKPESERYLQRSASKSAEEKLLGDRTTSEPIFCWNCGSDLSSLTYNQRNTHVNRCLDSRSSQKATNIPKTTDVMEDLFFIQEDTPTVSEMSQNSHSWGSTISRKKEAHVNVGIDASSQDKEFQKIPSKVKKESKTTKKSTKSKKTNPEGQFRCSLCVTKLCSSRSGLGRHMIHCQKKHKITTACAMALNKPHDSDDNFADDEILSQIRRVDRLDKEKTENTVALSPKVKKKRHPRKKKNDIENHNEEMLRLAIRVSTGDDLERKKSKKKNPKYVIPVMVEWSPSTKRRHLEHRFRSITNPPVEVVAGEIPSTPALPPSNLANSRVGVAHRNQTLGRNEGDSEQPGPSGVISHRDVLQTEHINNPNDDTQSSAQGYSNTACNLLNEELQSPEVSSSNIKHLSLSDNNDSHCLSLSNTALNDQAVIQSSPQQSIKRSPVVQRSNWSLACNEASTRNSDFRVRNLLSQFDKSSRAEDLNDVGDYSVIQPITDASQPLVNDVPDMKENLPDVDHIDSTLAVMKELDGAVDSVTLSQVDDVSFDVKISSSQQSESQKLNILIDNPRFSDAKIYVGADREVINLHKNILYCNCMKLLEEINVSEANSEKIFLENYTKREVMPMICFIYSGRIEPLVNTAKRDLNMFMKTKQLLKKYEVTIKDVDQVLLDAAVEQHGVQSQVYDKNRDDLPDACQSGDGSGLCEIEKEDNVDGVVLDKNDISFSEDLLPRNLTQPDPTFVDNSFANISDASATDDDLFVDCDKKVGGENSAQQLGDGVMKDNNMSNPNDLLGNGLVSDLNSSLFSEDNSASDLTFRHGDDSMSDLPNLSPSRRSKNELLPRAKKRKKEDVQIVTVRKSERVSLDKNQGSHGWRHRNCPCCSSGDHSSGESPKKSRASNKLQKTPKSSTKNLNLRKSLLSKQAHGFIKSPNRASIDKTASQSPHKGNARKRRSFSLPTLTSTPSTTAATLKKRKRLPKCDKPSSPIVVNPNSLEKKKQNICNEGNGHSHRKSQSQTIYIGERLPRFKEREHIRSRPEVANMGKSTRGLSRSMNRKVQSSKKSSKNKISSVPTKLDVANSKETATDAIAQFTQLDKVASMTRDEHLDVKPVMENLIVHNDSSKVICDDVELKQSSEHDAPSSSQLKSCINEQAPRPQYRFRKVSLAGYAVPSPLKQPDKDEKNSVPTVDVAACDSDEQSKDDLSLSDSFIDKFLDVSSKRGCSTHSDMTSAPKTPVTDTDRACSHNSTIYIGPVPITPMPDFQRMETPEVLHRASRLGLKKTLSKVKLMAKLEETYLYHHQTAPGPSFVDDRDLEINDDLKVNTDVECEDTVKLTKLSAPTSAYSFIKLPVEEIHKLSTDVVEATHASGTLLNALKSRKSETGSIKRGSRQDRARCWDIITPGRPQYDPKISSIISTSEDVQNAITRPLTGCVAKHYFDYKKYQFDCLRFLCDGIENLFKERSSA